MRFNVSGHFVTKITAARLAPFFDSLKLPTGSILSKKKGASYVVVKISNEGFTYRCCIISSKRITEFGTENSLIF